MEKMAKNSNEADIPSKSRRPQDDSFLALPYLESKLPPTKPQQESSSSRVSPPPDLLFDDDFLEDMDMVEEENESSDRLESALIQSMPKRINFSKELSSSRKKLKKVGKGGPSMKFSEKPLHLQEQINSASHEEELERPRKFILDKDLALGKRKLKKTDRTFKSVSLHRQDLFDSFETFDCFPIYDCQCMIKDQLATGNIMSLNFGGIDQLTDAFFFDLFKTNTTLPDLKILICAGCVHLTDLAAVWITELFPNLTTVNFNGCTKLTEKTIYQLLSMRNPPGEVLMIGANVGVGSPQAPDGSLKRDSFKLIGCPIVTHAYSGVPGNVPWNVHKLVILGDAELMPGIGETLIGQPVDGATYDPRLVKFWPNWTPKNMQSKFNVFEVAYSYSMSDLVLSDGSVVVLPYQAVKDVPLSSIIDSLYFRTCKVLSRYPDSVCVILEVTGGISDDASPQSKPALIKEKVQTRLTALNTAIKGQTHDCFQYKWVIDSLLFPTQNYLANWIKQARPLETVTLLHASFSLTGEDSPVAKPQKKSSSLFSSFSKSGLGAGESDIYGVLQAAVKVVDENQPYYRTISKELNSISGTVEGSKLQSLDQAYQAVSDDVKIALHPQCALPHVEKGYEILHLRGVAMYFRCKDRRLVAGDLSHLFSCVNNLLTVTPAAPGLLPKCVDSDALCWSRQGLMTTLQNVCSSDQADGILDVLEEQGCILPMYGKNSILGDKGDNSVPYLCLDYLPSQLPGPVSHLWPTAVGEGDIQGQMFYTFIPELPSSLLPCFIRECMRVSQIKVLWRRGMFIQQGPVDILIIQDWDSTGAPVITVSGRTFRAGDCEDRESPTLRCLWATLNMFFRILDYVILKYGVFAKVTVPCPTCVPGRGARIIQQLDHTKCHQFHLLSITDGQRCKLEKAKGNERKQFAAHQLLGPRMKKDSLVPRHDESYLDMTKKSFYINHRCFQCNRVSRDQSGEEKVLCPNCGTCSRCVDYLAEVEKTLSPGFSQARGAKGSLVSTNLEHSHLPIHNSMRPSLFNTIGLTLLRSNTPTLGLKFLKSGKSLTFNLQKGILNDPNLAEVKNTWKCNEGDTVTLKVCEGKSSAELLIVCLLNGFEMWRTAVERQSILPFFDSSSNTSVAFTLHTPGIRAYWQTDSPLDRLEEKMCLEFSESEDKIVSARITGNNGKVVTFMTDHRAPLSLENSKTVELLSDRLHPVGYAQCLGKPLNGATTPEAYHYNMRGTCYTAAPLWLFNEVQREETNPPREFSPDVMRCIFHPTPAAIACRSSQMKPYIEKALFRNGGVDFTGSAMVLLPGKKIVETMLWPARHLVASQDFLQCHPLCYIRGDCGDMLSLRPTMPQDMVSHNPYWQLHFLDAEGFPLPDHLKDNKDYLPLLWAWHLLFALQDECEVPTLDRFCPGLKENMPLSEVEQGIHEYAKFQMARLYLELGEIFLKTTDFFKNHDSLRKAATVIQEEVRGKVELSGLVEFVTMMAQDKILLCPAHASSQQNNAGLVDFPMAKFSSYTKFIASLQIEGNNLESLPDNFFSEFPSLLDLQLSSNSLFGLPAGIGNCQKLYTLRMGENQLVSLPDDLAECHGIFRLDISGNPMDNIPAVVMKLPKLERLYISNMQLHSLPENIGDLKTLQLLIAGGNCFSGLPKSFGQLESMKQLTLDGISWMPLKKNTLLSKVHFDKFLGKYARLLDWLEDHDHDKAVLYEQFDEDLNGTLDVHEVAKLNATLFHIFPRFGHQGSQLPDDDVYSGFPEEILSLNKLEYLSLQYQGLVILPETIEKLPKLHTINLSHNPHLVTVAAAAGKLPLKRLELEDCPSLKTPPKEIRARGFSSTYAYLRRLMTGSVECQRTKLMLVGLGGAGKTSLSKALLSGQFKTETSSAEAITDGIDISTWTVKSGDEHITYSVWDFAGQTVYYNTHQFFLSDRAVYLLLWNIRLGHEHAGLDFWLSSISVHAPKAPIFVVGTHVDKVSKTEIPMAEMRQKYPQISGFHFISSHSGQGVEDLQKQIYEVTLHQPYMGEKIPGVWLNFEKYIINTRKKESVVEYSQIVKMAAHSGIFDLSEVNQAVQFLHDLGTLQHFNNEFLKSYVVINPQWIVDVMTCVVSVKHSPIQEGKFYHKDIGVVWSDYPVELHQWLLRLTEEFDLTFPMADQQLNLVPCLLPEIQPEIEWPEVEKGSSVRETKMVYKFSYLPAGLFNRGQVRLYQFSDSSLIWKRGSMLRKNGHMALLEQSRGSELVVKVQGPRPENILFLVHEVFEGLIAESFHGVTYDYLIPCPDCLKTGTKEPHMFAASTVRRASELKAPFLQCLKYFHTISVIDLLSSMPPDNNTDYDIHLVSAVRGLKDLKKDLSADLFISYSPKNLSSKKSSDSIGPEDVNSDLNDAGYKCWFPKDSRHRNVDEMAKALIDCQVFVAFISNEYVVDKSCCDIFKYARLILEKPIILVVVGNGFQWKKSKLGILLADEVYVNMQKTDKYQDKLSELLGFIRDRSQRKNKDMEHPPCFVSYCWQNSAQAVTKGTRLTDGALGFGDPRGIKDYLEDNGVKCWIDVERVGMGGLFEDIAEGLLNAKAVVACVSDEYAMSPNCQFEFRFSANTLQLPIVLAVMGTGNAWRASEVGVLSLDYPMVSFQEKSETAHEKLLSLVRERLDQDTNPDDDTETRKRKKDQINERQKNMSFQELYELAQRKFLRQVAHYAEKQEALFPRLFVADFISTTLEEFDKTVEEDPEGQKSEDIASSETKSAEKRPLISKESKLSIDGERHEDFHRKQYCFYILCEHEEGWHSCAEPLVAQGEFGQTKLERYSPYLARVTTILRYNRQIMLNCMAGQDGEQYIHWLEQNPQAVESDFQNTYHELRQEIMRADQSGAMGKLARCHLPNGKTIWLCEEHQKASRVTVLSNEYVESSHVAMETQTENLMLEQLLTMDNQAIRTQFRAGQQRIRKSVERRRTLRKKTAKPASATQRKVSTKRTSNISPNKVTAVTPVAPNIKPAPPEQVDTLCKGETNSAPAERTSPVPTKPPPPTVQQDDGDIKPTVIEAKVENATNENINLVSCEQVNKLPSQSAAAPGDGKISQSQPEKTISSQSRAEQAAISDKTTNQNRPDSDQNQSNPSISSRGSSTVGRNSLMESSQESLRQMQQNQNQDDQSKRANRSKACIIG